MGSPRRQGSVFAFALTAVLAPSSCAGEPDADAPSVTEARAVDGASTPGWVDLRVLDSGVIAVHPRADAGFPSVVATLPARAGGALTLENSALHVSARVFVDGAADVDATVEGDSVRYPGGFGAGADLRFRPGPDGVEDFVELLERPASGVVRYTVELGRGAAGLRALGAIAPGSGVEILDESGTPALRASGAHVIDALAVRHELTLEVEGCAFDADPREPWGRAPVPPGSDRCGIVARIPDGVAYPAILDPLWSAANQMIGSRWSFEVAELPSGRFLVTGGQGDNSIRDESEIFDPVTGTWAATSSLPYGIIGFTLTGLPDGRLLLVGGIKSSMLGTTVTDETQLFDPASSTWAPGPASAIRRRYHTATALADGRVLVVGGGNSSVYCSTSCEIFDPSTDTFAPTQPLAVGRAVHAALGIDGRVLVAGGITPGTDSSDESLVFDPAAAGGVGGWISSQTFAVNRYSHVLARLGSDRVLMAGGYASGGIYAQQVELFDIATSTWSLSPATTAPRTEPTALPGPLGGVLLVGGCGVTPDPTYCENALSDVTWFDPVTGAGSSTEALLPARGKHRMVALPDGRIVVMGGQGYPDFAAAIGDTRVFQVLANGQPCESDFECLSAHCADGNCCDTACDGTCEACLATETGVASGTCAPVITGTDPDADCTDDGAPVCAQNGLCEAGACQTYAGAGCDARPCQDDGECTSGSCVDGVCCDTVCDSTCEACTAAKKGMGVDGVCGSVARATDPDLECPDVGGAGCDAVSWCDGDGTCAVASELCTPFACTAVGCGTSCADPSECAFGFACIGAACVPEASLCTNDTLGLTPDGTTIDCAPYRCEPSGSCLTTCASVDDCAPGVVCDPDTDRCVPPPPSHGGDAGCAIASLGTGGDGRSATFVALMLLLGLSIARRRGA